MSQFMFIYRDSKDPSTLSPEEMQADMEAWIGWINEAVAAGWMTNPGEALLPDSAATVRKDEVTDGPMIESKEIVGGFSIIEAENLQAAIALSQGCPAIASGGCVEVRAVMVMPEGC